METRNNAVESEHRPQGGVLPEAQAARPTGDVLTWGDPEPFATVWERAVDVNPDGVFLRYADPAGATKEWTYAGFDAEVRQVAGLLWCRGVRPGDAVHLALANGPAFVAIWLATIRLGAWMVPSDPHGKAPELSGHIGRTLPKLGFCATERSSVYRRACGETPFVALDEYSSDLSVLAGRELRRFPEPGPMERAAVMFTSGTTGLPKGVEITQANYAFCGKAMSEAAGPEKLLRQIVVLPLFHGNAQYYSFSSAVWCASSVALMPSFSASRFRAQAAEHEASAASLFAAPIRMILARGEEGGAVPRLAHCWYAQNLSDIQYEQTAEILGCRPRQLYGMTETLPAVLTEPEHDPVPSSMGMQTPHCIVDVQDGDGRSLPPGKVGEMVVGGVPGITLFAGYLDAPDITRASFRAGWFLTGDRARRGVDGRHYFDGRHSEILKVSGENVSVVAIEAVISAHPEVLEAAVVGMHDSIRDEVPVAFVVGRRPDSPPAQRDISAWCSERLSKAAMPRRFMMVDELPRTSVGKIRKYVLKERLGEEAPSN